MKTALIALAALLSGTTVAHAQPAPPPAATWVTLGTSGGPAVQTHRSQIANALVVNGAVYLFDTGNGVQRQMAFAGLKETDVKGIFLSHHHLDHNADLGPILVTHWTFGHGVIPVYGPEGTAALATGLAAANAPTILAAFPTGGPAKPPIAATFKATDLPANLQTETLVFEDANVRVFAIGVDHYQVAPSTPLSRMPDAVAYRVEAGGRVFVYSGDTGPSPRLQRLAQGADLLITEIVEPQAIAASLNVMMAGAPAAARQGIIGGMTKNHLAPGEIGRMARAAGVKKIVLTHFVPSPETAKDKAAFTRDLRKAYRGPVLLASDLGRF